MKHGKPSIKLALGALIVSGLLGFTAVGALAATTFFQGFETNTTDWSNQVVRVASGFTDGSAYADGIPSATGGFHARMQLDPLDTTCDPGVTDCSGPFTQWGGYESVFPTGGYKSSVDVYLDTAFAATHADYRFDWDSAINNSSGSHLQDYVFNAGTVPTGFVIGTSTNAFRSGAFPANPCPNPSVTPNTCRTPVVITTSGWYTFRHTFTDVGGFLDVRFEILDSSGVVVPGADWTIKTGNAISGVGGHRYGWFANQEIANLALDNTQLRGLALSADLSVSKADSPDPAHVGQKLTYTIPVTNNGPDSATGVTLSDTLPKSTGFGSVSTTQGTCTRSKQVVNCNIGTLASGATATVTIVVKPTQKGTITNTVTVAATSPTDPNTANNTATQNTLVKP